ncbi:hypothetical protein MLD38_003250 [Melastoma candidum]|uniref:Uncharacterized protein n=1 Tax=Melastoma candidum TaxID=119954 RepID=A0ACB9S3Y8_9MYRT|nr:hypothetical protein MLD38_003250 [Melastoma candidum]
MNACPSMESYFTHRISSLKVCSISWLSSDSWPLSSSFFPSNPSPHLEMLHHASAKQRLQGKPLTHPIFKQILPTLSRVECSFIEGIRHSCGVLRNTFQGSSLG